MNIYFSSSGRFYKENKELYDKIIKYLTKYGNKKPYIALGDIDYDKSSEKEIVQSVKRMEKELNNADIIVTENSYSVAGIGYESAIAVKNRKPVLVLSMKDSTKDSDLGPHPMTTLKHKFLTLKKYNEKNLETIIEEFIDDAKGKIDTKFILIISPEIDRYLEWASDYKRMHKAQIVRNAVEKEIERDAEYKEYLNKN